MFNLGLSEIILISVIALIFIGPKQLPEIARALGRALNELKKASEDLSSTIINPKNFTHHNEKHEDLPSHYSHRSSHHYMDESNAATSDLHGSSVSEQIAEETLKVSEEVKETQELADSSSEDKTTIESKKVDT